MPIESITSLANLVEVENTKAILRRYVGNRPDAISSFTHGLAKMLIHVACHWVKVPAAQLALLQDAKRRLGPERAGMTEASRELLRALSDEHIEQRLLHLPSDLAAEAKRAPQGNIRAALKMQLAVALEILLMAPMRGINLGDLRLDRHIVEPGGSRGEMFIILVDDETKNGQPMEFPLPRESADLVRLYLRRFRPRLCAADVLWVFPNKNGGHKSQATLCQQLETVIWQRVGIRMSIHKFRHYAGSSSIEAEPGNFEQPRLVLGHVSTKTTSTYYTGRKTALAVRHYSSLVVAKRQKLRTRRPGRRKPR